MSSLSESMFSRPIAEIIEKCLGGVEAKTVLRIGVFELLCRLVFNLIATCADKSRRPDIWPGEYSLKSVKAVNPDLIVIKLSFPQPVQITIVYKPDEDHYECGLALEIGTKIFITAYEHREKLLRFAEDSLSEIAQLNEVKRTGFI